MRSEKEIRTQLEWLLATQKLGETLGHMPWPEHFEPDILILKWVLEEEE